jgi:hypothetical protein
VVDVLDVVPKNRTGVLPGFSALERVPFDCGLPFSIVNDSTKRSWYVGGQQSAECGFEIPAAFQKFRSIGNQACSVTLDAKRIAMHGADVFTIGRVDFQSVIRSVNHDPRRIKRHNKSRHTTRTSGVVGFGRVGGLW